MSKHHFTVDVEEYFQVSALEAYAPYERWESFESRVEGSVDRLLELLERHGATATFFTLGWVAERFPGMIGRIVRGGHELASHGWRHRLVSRLDADAFRESVRRSKRVLEDVSGAQVEGYRAPSFSIGRAQEWAFGVLAEEGYTYDSSVYPGRRGHEGRSRAPYEIRTGAGVLREVPIATLRVPGRTLPAGGGAYLRILPETLLHRALAQASAEGRSGVVYVHPWEIDPAQPRFSVPLRTRVRHYHGLTRMERRLERLLTRFAFQSIAAGTAAPVEPAADEPAADVPVLAEPIR